MQQPSVAQPPTSDWLHSLAENYALKKISTKEKGMCLFLVEHFPLFLDQQRTLTCVFLLFLFYFFLFLLKIFGFISEDVLYLEKAYLSEH